MPGARVHWCGDDVPLEVLDAAGCRLARLQADPAAPGPEADAYKEGGGHPLVRALAAGMMAAGAAGGVPVISAAATAQSSAYRLFQCLPESTPGRPYLVQLAHVPGAAAQAFNRRAVARLADDCGADRAALQAAIVRRNALRCIIAAADALRTAWKPRLSGSVALEWQAAYGTQAEVGLGDTLAVYAGVAALPQGVRAVVIGGLRTPDFYRALEQQGFHVVGETPDLGQTPPPAHVDETGDPLEQLALAYGAAAPCVGQWVRDVQASATALRAAAVILALPGYDHPTAWSVPLLRAGLAAQGIRSLVAPDDCFSDLAGAAAAIAAQWEQAA